MQRVFLLFDLLWITMLMLLDKVRGRGIIVYNVSSTGFPQFLTPIHKELCKQSQKWGYYLALPHEIKRGLEVFDIPKRKHFPLVINRFLWFCDVFIEPEIWDRGPENATRIMVGHGHPNKHTHWSAENLKAVDVYFLYGPLLREQIGRLQQINPEGWESIELMNIGYPKTDDLFDETYKKEEVLSDLGLDPSIKTILYAPAWDPGGSLRVHGKAIVKELSEIPNVNILVKLHPASMESADSVNYEFYTGGVDWNKVFSKYNSDKFRFVNEHLVNPLLVCADVLITDFSGVSLEFMALYKPVIFLDCPEFYEKTLPKWGHDPELAKTSDLFNSGRNYGKLVYQEDDLSEALLDVMENPDELLEGRKYITNKFLYNRGMGSSVAADEIFKIYRARKFSKHGI